MSVAPAPASAPTPTPAPAPGPSPRSASRSAALIALLALAGCTPGGGDTPLCSVEGDATTLPPELQESSGVAASVAHPGVFWTHNDAGSVLFAIDRQGTVLGRYRLSRNLRDWEDLAIAPCEDGRWCLYLADLGDNYEERTAVQILRVREPDPSGSGTLMVDLFPVSLPDGPRDIEALFVLPGERLLAVSKGRNHPVTVYRYPGPLRSGRAVLEEVQQLTDRARIFPRQVTGATATPDGGLIAVRTYSAVQFYTMQGDTLAAVDGGSFDVRPLGEAQGEGVTFSGNGGLVLTSEGGPGGGPGSLSVLRCAITER